MKTFKDIRESKVLSKKKIKGIPLEIKNGKKGFELRIDGDLVADNFKTEKEAKDTAQEVLKALGK